MTNSAFDDWFTYLLKFVFTVGDAITILLSIPKKGICIDPKIQLQKLTVKQLKKILVGHKTTNLKKDQLIDLVLTLT